MECVNEVGDRRREKTKISCQKVVDQDSAPDQDCDSAHEIGRFHPYNPNELLPSSHAKPKHRAVQSYSAFVSP